MNYVIDLKDAVLDLSLENQLELSIYLLDGLRCYSETYLQDGDDLQYRRFLNIKNLLERSLSSLSLIEPADLHL
jgi:hypothetical protein